MAYVHRLKRSPEAAAPAALPDGVSREFLPSPGGPLELLVASPPPPTDSHEGSSEEKPPLLFVHGGFGTAGCFVNYLTYFSSRGYSCYSISLRGHGASYTTSYWTMLLTPMKTLCSDLELAIYHIRDKHTKPVILLGHSSGGGISQYLISLGQEKVGGFVALAAVPGFGIYPVYWNWLKLDPWCLARFYFRHLGHPRSPLSTTKLVHRAYFSASFPTSGVEDLERAMPEYDSLSWPTNMTTTFVDPKAVLENITPALKKGKRILVVAATADKLMTEGMMEKLSAWYKTAWENLSGGDGGESAAGDVISYATVEGSGHYLMRDTAWEEGAKLVFDWLEH